MALQFNQKPYGSLIGSGTYQFRHYGSEASEEILLDRFTIPQSLTSIVFLNSMTPLSLSITADDCSGKDTTTIIHWTMVYDLGTGETITATGTDISEPFPQNTSTTQTVTRTTTYTKEGLTASATFTQGVWISKSYSLTLSGITSYGFVKDTSILSLDQNVYDGPYKSNNQDRNSTYAVARINVTGYTEFTIWINSYAESSYDYTVASQINASTYPTAYTAGYNGNGYSNSTASYSGKYSNTSNYQKGPSNGLSESYWRKITYALDGGDNTIYITYRKDGSSRSNTDTGCFVIEK